MTGLTPTTPVYDVRRSLPTHATKKFRQRDPSKIRGLVVHHTASFAQLRAVAAYHVGPNHISNTGAPGLLYHFYIDPDGSCFLCNDLEAVTWSQGGGSVPVPYLGSNTSFVSVAIAGNLSETPPRPAQVVALRWLWSWLASSLHLGSDMVFTHSEFRQTMCPGDALRAVVGQMASRGDYVREHLPRNAKEWQTALNRLGSDLTVDGVFGSKSREALQRHVLEGAYEDFDTAYALARLLYRVQS